MRCCLLYLLFFVTLCNGQEQITISLITTTPGEFAHTKFGHSALRVMKADSDFDKIYNFGLFDFETPGFALKFLQGDLEYWLGRQTVDGFIQLNNREGRIVQEQVLNLSEEQAQGIADDLEYLRQEEHKYYRYSFTKNNCTTQIRELFLKHQIISPDQNARITRRAALEPFVESSPWFRFGINLMLGLESDQVPDVKDAIYLPRDLQSVVANTDGLVLEIKRLNKIDIKKDQIFYWYSPFVIFSTLGLLLLFFKPLWLSRFIFALTGLIGCFVLYIALTSFHSEFHTNFNLLWCNPVYLPFAIFTRRRTFQKYTNHFLLACLLIVLGSWIIGALNFDLAIIPFIFCLFILHRRRFVALK